MGRKSNDADRGWIGVTGLALAGQAIAPPPAEDLDTALLAAHARDDRSALIGLYEDAAAASPGSASAFYLTHAYVFALETGDTRAASLKARLVALGADVPDPAPL